MINTYNSGYDPQSGFFTKDRLGHNIPRIAYCFIYNHFEEWKVNGEICSICRNTLLSPIPLSEIL